MYCTDSSHVAPNEVHNYWLQAIAKNLIAEQSKLQRWRSLLFNARWFSSIASHTQVIAQRPS
ncbi:hypothetical protein [Aliterella atlantica]|uniref:Uncharacterized protein n=1 Tax=Aliterella atlantica CENA595 TaxID=1618023 RepID=A0A0D8ZXC6_9CYAN|nr:hypothetical protein [Aliterella atlantica]KJH71861.1 hypothetical protein UH38_10820 [Aliterella atlantica CENA595]